MGKSTGYHEQYNRVQIQPQFEWHLYNSVPNSS